MKNYTTKLKTFFQIFINSLVVISLTISVLSCSKDDSDDSDSSGTLSSAGSEDYLSATVDGVEYDFTSSVSRTSGAGFFYFSGQSNFAGQLNHLLTLSMLDTVVGTYEIEADYYAPDISYTNYTYYYSEFTFYEDALSGEMTITTNDDEWIEGTFNATIIDVHETDTVSITNGKFGILK